MKEYGSVKVTLSSWGPDRKGATHMTNANALPIQERLRAAFDADDVAEKNLALRAGHDRIDALEAAIKRQSGAAKTLRESTLAEVRHLQDKDRSEYTATQTLDSEREANAILTDEVERLTTRIDALEAALRGIRDKPRINGKRVLYHIEEVEDIARAALGDGE